MFKQTNLYSMLELVNIYMYIYFTIFIFSLPIKNMNDPRMVM